MFLTILIMNWAAPGQVTYFLVGARKYTGQYFNNNSPSRRQQIENNQEPRQHTQLLVYNRNLTNLPSVELKPQNKFTARKAQTSVRQKLRGGTLSCFNTEPSFCSLYWGNMTSNAGHGINTVSAFFSFFFQRSIFCSDEGKLMWQQHLWWKSIAASCCFTVQPVRTDRFLESDVCKKKKKRATEFDSYSLFLWFKNRTTFLCTTLCDCGDDRCDPTAAGVTPA